MEAIITVVGFLGAGKTTLLRRLMTRYIKDGWNPYIILNDYENANLDVQQFLEEGDPQWVKALSGSCICCSGINELRDYINNLPQREKGITLIEANGTSDACSLMGFLGVGLNNHFLPPVQISVVDVKNWQQRGEHNELEANQIQVSSLIILTHLDQTSKERQKQVLDEVIKINPYAQTTTLEDIDISILPQLLPSENNTKQLDHLKAHWSSFSIDLPPLPDEESIYDLCDALPPSILRVKGCTKIAHQQEYTYFEKTPDGEVYIRPFKGSPTTGAKLLTIGVGSNHSTLQGAILSCLSKAESRL